MIRLYAKLLWICLEGHLYCKRIMRHPGLGKLNNSTNSFFGLAIGAIKITQKAVVIFYIWFKNYFLRQ